MDPDCFVSPKWAKLGFIRMAPMVSYGILRYFAAEKWLPNLCFPGDALGAWNALNLEGSDLLSEREMDFLDDMELDMLAAYVSATEAAEQLEAEKHKVDRWDQLGR